MEQAETKRGHACLISYAGTADASFPLILVVGREPNEDLPPSEEAGDYNFRKSGRCAFWNVAYSLFGSVANPPRSTRQIKAEAEAAGASPILFADALPITLRHAARNKVAQRLAIEDAAIERHVAAVFSHRSLINRVRVIILSGLGPSFERSVAAYRRLAEERGIALAELPFFYPTNMPAIRERLGNELRSHLADVLHDFDEHARRIAAARAA
ncbi:hypothetical protein AB6806_11005 [Bosea sp. RCC_152_1]|uniref:hypothetical protein n=1 Tax=Bosea sp. RCC_152_1 TaxID=3239228 RepID=UPI0035264B5D